MDDGLDEFADFKTVTKLDISDMAEAFGKQTNANGEIIFGHGGMKGLKGLIQWAHNQYRCSDPIVHVKFTVGKMNLTME